MGLDVIRLNKGSHYSLLGLKNLPVRTIIDAGANTGQFARMIEKIFPEANIYCFEPLGEGFQLRGRREEVKKARKNSLSPFYAREMPRYFTVALCAQEGLKKTIDWYRNKK
jgi:hypothetical protein